MTDIHLTYNAGNGRMTIHCDNFFPTSQNKFRQLLKVVDMDFDHRDDILNSIMQFLKKAERDSLEEKTSLSHEYWKEHQKMCDLQHLIDDGRFPNGLPLKKDDRKKVKEDLKEQKKVVNSLEQQVKSADRKAKKLRSNQDFMKEVYGGSWE